ncbi:MAG: hypothetical protein GX879_05190, partial [Bacteroidales bacterium]|nr:hypothetical protein [Bacteroidales bacterium]
MKKIFLILTLLIAAKGIYAQEESWRCASAEMNRIEMENNPQARANWENLQIFIDDYIKENKDSKNLDVYIIPVVFHIVHNYGPENISKEQINDQIRILNEDYRRLNPDTVDIIPPFKQLATDSRIEFRLAQIDPNGNCTDGVTRTISFQTYYGSEEIKNIAPSWPNSKYLNVWVVNRIPGGVAGYAYYPGTAPNGRDGIMITHSYIGSIGTGDIGKSRTLTHEVGHYLSLPHPWGSTNEPGLQSNCNIDDGIEDTPNTIGHTSCNLWAVTCGSLDNVQNYMDYSYCCRMFTHGQGARMRAALNSNASQRNNLWTESNLIATGTNDPDYIAVCEPIADWQQNKIVTCINEEVEYYDLSYNTSEIASRTWQIEGANPETSNEKNPIVIYQNAGKYSTELYVANSTGSDSKSKTNNISAYNHNDAVELPFIYDFENNDFPYLQSGINNDFTIVAEGSQNWERTNSTGFSGNYSMRLINKNNENNITNSFYTPLVKVDSTMFPLTIKFKVAYAKTYSTSNDKLKVYYSSNCGDYWRLRYNKPGVSLRTTDNLVQYGNFVPNAEQWREDEIIIMEPYDKECQSLRLKFEAISGGGNAIYI